MPRISRLDFYYRVKKEFADEPSQNSEEFVPGFVLAQRWPAIAPFLPVFIQGGHNPEPVFEITILRDLELTEVLLVGQMSPIEEY